MIITCPHCQTKYQVTYEAIGSAGRKVQCAHCQQAWQQRPLDKVDEAPEHKKAFENIAEDALDDAMASEEHAVAAEVARRVEQERQAQEAVTSIKVDAALVRKRQKAFARRQVAMAAELPLGRLRRTLRVVGLVLLAAVLALGYFGRVQLVTRFPALAGAYEAVGLGVNVVGLEFSNVSSQRTLRDGKEMLAVSAQIVGLMAEPVAVPSVLVTLIDEHGRGIYEWSVTPSVRDLMAGERSTFDTQLTLPPGSAERVRLTFAGGQSAPITAHAGDEVAEAPAAEAAEPAHSGEAAHGAPAEHGTETEHAAPAATEHDAAPAANDHAAPAAASEHH